MAYSSRAVRSPENYCDRSIRWSRWLLQWAQVNERARDAAPAVVLVACSAGAIVVSGNAWRPGHLGEVAWMAASCVPLIRRSRWPLSAAAAALCIDVACMSLAPAFVLAPAASLVALYALATRAGYRVSWAAGLAAAAAITATYALTHAQPARLGATLVNFDAVIIAVGAGVVVRVRRARLVAAEVRAERAERSRAEEEARRRAAEERLRRGGQRPGGEDELTAGGADVTRQLAALTRREREIMTLIATGLSNEEIAGRLFLARVTVKTHANRAMAKLGARDRAQLVVAAYETGLVQPARADRERAG
jgi:DNA-binding CsgD family transcriptional regulator